MLARLLTTAPSAPAYEMKKADVILSFGESRICWHVCPHGIPLRSRCFACGASALHRSVGKPTGGPCPHGKRRCRCVHCGGVSVCEHGRLRTVCRDCGGGSLCPHGRQRFRCKECQITCVAHGRVLALCKQCRPLA